MIRLSHALLLGSAFLIGCGSDVPHDLPAQDNGMLLTPPPPGQGVQYRMVGDIAAGAEVEQCKFVQAPSNGLWVNRDEVRFDEGSHHFILFETGYDSIPTEKDDGTPIDTSDVFDCSDGPTNGWSITRLVGGSQNYAGDPAVRFPEGVALRVRPNVCPLPRFPKSSLSPICWPPNTKVSTGSWKQVSRSYSTRSSRLKTSPEVSPST